MAAQKTLTWNGVTICDNTLKMSGYVVVEKHRSGDFFEYSFPNSTGRFKRQIGSQNTAATSRTIEMNGTTHAVEIADLRSIVTSIGTASAGSTPHGTLSYGILNDDTTPQAETLMDCDFKVTRFWQNTSGEFFMEWTARFSKWSA